MTLNELKQDIDNAISNGYGEAKVYFDSEARRFNVHLVDIEIASMLTYVDADDKINIDKELFILHADDKFLNSITEL